MSVEFNDHECICVHEAYEHDDGFGCTVPGCECVAGWRLADD